ncbi:MAG: hypothetical protein IPL19_19715 [Sandaracinaceae bacterium]|nr:hypothetical protein [Sandaracinaceae bacterium]
MPGWLDELSERAGPLRAAALTFCAWRSLDPNARGVQAAEALGRTLDAFCHEAEGDDPYEEDRFIEGAGAYLGLLALDAHGGAGHRQTEGRHRVCLGARGWFDPFAAIDAALDAEQPLLALADSLALAEAEAHDGGPVSRVLAASTPRSRATTPEAHAVQRFELDVELDDGTQIDLRRLASGLGWPHTEEEQRRLLRDAERLVAMLPRRGATGAARAKTPAEVSESLARLLPRPVSVGFAGDLPEGVELATLALEADVLLAYGAARRPRALPARRGAPRARRRGAGPRRRAAEPAAAVRGHAVRAARSPGPHMARGQVGRRPRRGAHRPARGPRACAHPAARRGRSRHPAPRHHLVRPA